jgi:hypothetical protein
VLGRGSVRECRGPASGVAEVRAFPQVDSLCCVVMVDRCGRRLEVIVLDRGHGAQQWIRVSVRGVLLGRGYYRDPHEALLLVDVDSLVELVELDRHRSARPHTTT